MSSEHGASSYAGDTVVKPDAKSSSTSDENYTSSVFGGYNVIISGRPTVVDGSTVGVGTVSVVSTDSGVFADLQTSPDEITIEEVFDDDLDAENGSSTLYLDDPPGCCCCRNSSCCRDEAIYCRSCASSSRKFVGEVSDIVGRMELRRKVRGLFRVQTIKDRLPITLWLPKYRLTHLQGDIVAGLAVGLTVIPQSIAYAKVANLDPQYGLYTSFMGCFIYTLFGSSKDVTIGPVAIISLLTATLAASPIPGDATYAILVSLIGGCMQLLMGLFKIGFVIDYISHPVVNSFTTASALTIAEGQLKKWLGLKVSLPRDFFNELFGVLRNIPSARLYDFLLGVICMILLHVLKIVKDVKLKNPNKTLVKRALQYFIWLLGTARNAVVVLLAGAASAIFASNNLMPFSASNKIPPGLPPFRVPQFTLYVPQTNQTVSTSEIFSSIGAGFILIPLMGTLEAIAIGKAFATKNGYRIDANQELIAMGIGNFLGSFVSAYPATGSFSRTAVNSQSGVKTPLGGVVTGFIVILSLLFLTPYFNFIPDSALAAVIIAAVADLVDFSLLVHLWHVNKAEIFPWLLTFGLSLGIGVEYGIIAGVGWTLLTLLWPWNRPVIKVVRDEPMCVDTVPGQASHSRIIVLSISHGNLFPSIERLKDKISDNAGVVNSIVLDFAHVAFVDFTTIELKKNLPTVVGAPPLDPPLGFVNSKPFQGLGHLMSQFSHTGNTLVMAAVQPHIMSVFKSAKLKHCHHAPSTEEAIQQIRALQIARSKPTVVIDAVDDVTDGVGDVVLQADARHVATHQPLAEQNGELGGEHNEGFTDL